MDDLTPEKLDALLRRVAGLLAKADHANTGEEEADTYRAKADELMRRYRIEESQLIVENLSDLKPILREWPICEAFSEFLRDYIDLMSVVCEHAEVRWAYKTGTDPDNPSVRSYMAQIVGYEADVRYATMLFTALRLQFSSRLEPKIDPSMTDEENVYNLRSAGIERNRIARMMGWGDTHSAHGRVGKAYKAACAKREEEALMSGRGNSAPLYRKTFASEFVYEVGTRLRRARMASGIGNAGEMVLVGRKEKVTEAYYTHFPHLRPRTLTEEEKEAYRKAALKESRRKPRKPKPERYSDAGVRAGRKAGREADIDLRTGSQKRGVSE